MCGTDTRTAVLYRLVGDGEFAKIVPDHFRLDFNGVESFAVVDTNYTTNHFRNNDHVPKVRLDSGRLVGSDSLLFLVCVKVRDEKCKINDMMCDVLGIRPCAGA